MVENHRQANDAHRLRHHRCGQCRRERPAGGCGDTERARPCPHRTVTPLQSRSRMVEITGKPTTLTGYGITDAVNVEEKGQPEGVATLDDQGYVPTEQLPALDFTPADGSITTPKLA